MTTKYETPELEIVEFDDNCAMCLEAISGDQPDLGTSGQSTDGPSSQSLPY